MSRLCLPLLALLLGACATDPQPVAQGPTPADVVASGRADATVHWGGRIVAITNLRDRTRLEILALPLDGAGRPRSGAAAQGRFVVDKSGFLEPQEYAVDRLVSAHGILHGFAEGKVGDASYRYPVLLSERLTLWPDDDGPLSGPRRPRVNFGIGVGSSGSGVGVGIGF